MTALVKLKILLKKLVYRFWQQYLLMKIFVARVLVMKLLANQTVNGVHYLGNWLQMLPVLPQFIQNHLIRINY